MALVSRNVTKRFTVGGKKYKFSPIQVHATLNAKCGIE